MSATNFPKNFPCPVCGRFCKVGITKKDKPYYVCELCGIQVFIRAEDGVRRFAEFKDSDLLKALKGKDSLNSVELIRSQEKIELIKLKIAEIKSELPLLGDEVLENQITELKKSLEELNNAYFQQLINN